jgi:Zn-dependent protease with chaperone function
VSPAPAAALALALLAIALAWPVPQSLARARWTERSPRTGLLLWQAVGLAGGVAAVGAGVALGLAPLGDSAADGLGALARQSFAGDPLRGLGPLQLLGLAWAGGLAGRLLWVLASSSLSTARTRRRHRALVDLVATPWPTLGGARVLDHPNAVAYCLPGLRPRVVVSAGALAVLTTQELAAVLAHERAHATERHDLVVSPFVALGATLPVLPTVRWAQESVAQLVDDQARRAHDPRALASALVRVGAHRATPQGALAVADSAVVARVRRLLEPPAPAPLPVRAAALLAAVWVLVLPLVLLTAPQLLLPV